MKKYFVLLCISFFTLQSAEQKPALEVPVIFGDTGTTSYLYTRDFLEQSLTLKAMLGDLGEDDKDPIVLPNIKKSVFEQVGNYSDASTFSLQELSVKEIEELIKTLNYLDFNGKQYKTLWDQLVTRVLLDKSQNNNLFDKFFTTEIKEGHRIVNENSMLRNNDQTEQVIRKVLPDLPENKKNILSKLYPKVNLYFNADQYKTTAYEKKPRFIEPYVSHLFEYLKSKQVAYEKIVKQISRVFKEEYEEPHEQPVLLSLSLYAIKTYDVQLIEELINQGLDMSLLESLLKPIDIKSGSYIIEWHKILDWSKPESNNFLEIFLQNGFETDNASQYDSGRFDTETQYTSILLEILENSHASSALMSSFLHANLSFLWTAKDEITSEQSGGSEILDTFLNQLLSKPENFWKPVLDSIKDHKDFNENVIAVFAEKVYCNEETKNKFIQWLLNTKRQEGLDLIMPFLSEFELIKWAGYLEPETD